MDDEKWAGENLLDRLRQFEQELRAAGLSDNTVNTYVGGADTFVRWLMGRYVPVGPNAGSDRSLQVPNTKGQSLLDEFADQLDATQVARCLADYAAVTSYDGALRRLYRATGGKAPNLDVATDRIAVIEWLRGWGCRHLRKTDTQRTSDALRSWWEEWNASLPDPSVAITELSPSDLSGIAETYEALRSVPAAGRALRGGEVDVLFGDTAGAKTLFVVRPPTFLPWDDPIRLAFGCTGGGAAYASLLERSAAALRGLAARLEVPVAELPKILGRPSSSPAKIIDEYLWVKVTRAL